MSRYVLVSLGTILLAVCMVFAWAQPKLPQLTGHVVDEASLLSSAVKSEIAQLADEHRRTTSNQVVVVTLSSLKGYDIEEYGVRLGRHWGIGEEGKDNGVLFIIAPEERETRIEVGYGLEGFLTDAISRDGPERMGRINVARKVGQSL